MEFSSLHAYVNNQDVYAEDVVFKFQSLYLLLKWFPNWKT